MNRSFFARRPGLSMVIVLVTALAGGLVGYLVSNAQTPQYSSTARYVVGPGPALLTGDARDLVLGLDALGGPTIVATYAEVMASQSIVYEAAGDIGLDTVLLADYEFTPVEVPGASLIDLTVTGPDPVVAASLANAVGDRAGNLAGTLFSAYEVAPLDIALAASQPSSPQPSRDAVLAAVFAGGLAGFMLLQTLVGFSRPALAAAAGTASVAATHGTREAEEERIDVDLHWIPTPDPTLPDQVPDAAYVDYVEHSQDGRAIDEGGTGEFDGELAEQFDDTDTTPDLDDDETVEQDDYDELIDQDEDDDDDEDFASMDGPAGR
jgi:capsular polysaccharide biosynthesis protein